MSNKQLLAEVTLKSNRSYNMILPKESRCCLIGWYFLQKIPLVSWEQLVAPSHFFEIFMILTKVSKILYFGWNLPHFKDILLTYVHYVRTCLNERWIESATYLQLGSNYQNVIVKVPCFRMFYCSVNSDVVVRFTVIRKNRFIKTRVNPFTNVM